MAPSHAAMLAAAGQVAVERDAELSINDIIGDGLIDEDEAGKILGLSVRSLQGFRLKGNGPPYVKIGRRVLYSRAELAAYIAARRRTSTSDQGC